MIFLLTLCLLLPMQSLDSALDKSSWLNGANNVTDALGNVHAILQDCTEKERDRYNAQIQIAAEELARIGALKDQKKIGPTEFETKQALLKQKIETAQKRLDDIEQDCKETGKIASNLFATGFTAVMEIEKTKQLAKANLAVEVEKAKQTQKAANEGALERLKFLTDADVLKRLAVYGGLGALGVSSAVYGSQLGMRYLQRKLEKVPDLVRETSRTNWLKNAMVSLRVWWAGKQLQAHIDEDFIFPPETLAQLTPIAEQTGKLHEILQPFPLLFLYGPPGTGKTAFAKWLALNTGMDYAIVSGSEIVKHPNGLMALRELIEWAKECPNGLILFIDEIDAIAFDRNRNRDRDVVILLEELLVLMSDEDVLRTCKFVAATNRREDIDAAVLSRFDDQIEVGLPGECERKQLFDLYLKKYITGKSHLIKENGTMRLVDIAVAPEITEEFLNDVATKTAGCSGRTVSKMVRKMQTEALFNKDHVLTAPMMIQIVESRMRQL